MAVRRRWLAGLLLLLALPAAAQDAPAQVLRIEGQVQRPQALGLAELRAMPQVSVSVTYQTGRGEQRGTFAGPLLWPLVQAAGPVDEPGRATFLRHTVLARGSDGYAAALAIGELDPGFAGKSVIVALTQEGTPLPAPRLIVPGDVRAGRAVRDLVAVEVR